MIHGETESNEEFMIFFPSHRIPTSTTDLLISEMDKVCWCCAFTRDGFCCCCCCEQENKIKTEINKANEAFTLFQENIVACVCRARSKSIILTSI